MAVTLLLPEAVPTSFLAPGPAAEGVPKAATHLTPRSRVAEKLQERWEVEWSKFRQQERGTCSFFLYCMKVLQTNTKTKKMPGEQGMLLMNHLLHEKRFRWGSQTKFESSGTFQNNKV